MGPNGRSAIHIEAAVAPGNHVFDDRIISEQVKADLINARRKGNRLGKPSVLPMVIEKAKTVRKQALSYRKIGKRLKVSEGLVRKKLK